MIYNEIISCNIPSPLWYPYSCEYGYHKGLGILPGEIVKFDDKNYKVPHIGWNSIEVVSDNKLLKKMNNKHVYFVHSYYLESSEYAIAKTCYAGKTYVSAVKYNNIYATQFHPEKSGDVGLEILKNFGDL